MNSPILILCLLTAAGVLALEDFDDSTESFEIFPLERKPPGWPFYSGENLRDDCCEGCSCLCLEIIRSEKPIDINAMLENLDQELVEHKIPPNPEIQKNIAKWFKSDLVQKLIFLHVTSAGGKEVYQSFTDKPYVIEGVKQFSPFEEVTLLYRTQPPKTQNPPILTLATKSVYDEALEIDSVHGMLKEITQMDFNKNWLDSFLKHFKFYAKKNRAKEAMNEYEERYDQKTNPAAPLRFSEMLYETNGEKWEGKMFEKFDSNQKSIISFGSCRDCDDDDVSIIQIIDRMMLKTELYLTEISTSPSKWTLKIVKENLSFPEVSLESVQEIVAALAHVPLSEVHPGDVAAISKILREICAFEAAADHEIEFKTPVKSFKQTQRKIRI